MGRRGVLVVVAFALLLGAASPAGAMVGGKKAAHGEFSFAAAMLVEGRLYCTGSVIAAQWVLTAAHCVDETDLRRTTIRVGSNNRSKGGALIPVRAFLMHPRYNFDDLASYDVALLHLERPVPAGVRPISLSGPGDDYLERGGTRLTVIGWGSHVPGPFNPSIDTALWKSETRVVDDLSCYGESGGEHALVGICGRKLGSSPCYGDSGGALFKRVGSRVVHVGTTSNLIGDCGVPFPVEWAETNNPSVRAFIRQHAGV